MSRVKSVCVILSFLFFASCAREFGISSIELGSRLEGKGHITDPTLEFSFTYKGKDRLGDLFNFVYFEGDTVCFSADFTRDLGSPVRAVFIDPQSGTTFPAERIELIRARAYGFSLVGSLLEHFNRKRLNDRLPAGRVIRQPFVLHIEGYDRGRAASRNVKGEFVVRF